MQTMFFYYKYSFYFWHLCTLKFLLILLNYKIHKLPMSTCNFQKFEHLIIWKFLLSSIKWTKRLIANSVFSGMGFLHVSAEIWWITKKFPESIAFCVCFAIVSALFTSMHTCVIFYLQKICEGCYNEQSLIHGFLFYSLLELVLKKTWHQKNSKLEEIVN